MNLLSCHFLHYRYQNSGILIHKEKQHKRFVVRGRKQLNLDIQWNYEHDEQEALTSHLTNPTEYAKAEQRSGMKRGGGDGHGEIIQVQGGHIVRAAGGKDRHSKVYTSKGPRDRRVRLSAHTAIQFYDVQDRLGYDRPSKAVDWLITKARTAIDNLAELPGQTATAAVPETSNPGSSEPSNAVYEGTSSAIPAHAQQSIADTMRSFFPVSPEDSSLINMHSFEDGRMSTQQAPLQMGDLGLSLHSLQDQNMNQMVFSGSNNPEIFEANYHKSSEASWNTGEGESNNGTIGFVFNPHSVPQQLYLSQNSSSSAFSQREPLQSNNYSNPLNHPAWIANQPHMDHHQTTHQPFNQSAFYNIHFGSDFQVLSRIRGEEDTGGASIQQSSASPTGGRH